jgi:hypothetical protein
MSNLIRTRLLRQILKNPKPNKANMKQLLTIVQVVVVVVVVVVAVRLLLQAAVVFQNLAIKFSHRSLTKWTQTKMIRTNLQ